MSRFLSMLTRWWWLEIILLILLSGLLAHLSTSRGWLEMKYTSSVVVETLPIHEIDPIVSHKVSSNREFQTRAFMSPAFENRVVTPSLIDLMLDNQSIRAELGGDRRTAIQKLSEVLATETDSETGYVRITATTHDAAFSKAILLYVIDEYRLRRKQLASAHRQEQLKAIQIEFQNKSDRVREISRRLRQLQDQTHREPSSLTLEKPSSSDDIALAKKEYQRAQAIRAELRNKYNKELAKTYSSNHLVVHQGPDASSRLGGESWLCALVIMILPLSTILFVCFAEFIFPKRVVA